MATSEPPQRKRKVEKTTTPPRTVIAGFTVEKDGTYVRVEKPVEISAWSSDDDVDPVLEDEYYRQLNEADGFDLNMRNATFYISFSEDVEKSNKLKSENATFYISFSDCGQTEYHRAVVRRVTDGIPGHVSLEAKVKLRDLCSIT